MPATSLRRLLWLLAALGLGLTTGPGGALLLAVAAVVALWWPGTPLAQALGRLVLAGCVAVASWLLSTILAAVLAALAVVDLLRARDRTPWMLGATALILAALGGLALAGPRPPSMSPWLTLRALAALTLLVWVWRRAGVDDDARGLVLATVTCSLLVALRIGLWSAGAPPLAATPAGVEPRWVEAARLGLRQRAATGFRDLVCQALARGDRRGAVRTLSWGAAFAPTPLAGAEAALWKVSLIAPGDPPQAQRLASRVFREVRPASVAAAARPLARSLVLQLAEWSEREGRGELTEALVRESLRPSSVDAFTRCPPRP